MLAFSGTGEMLENKLTVVLRAKGHEISMMRCASGELAAWTKEHFVSDDALVFVGSCGIAVRAIAPFVKSKTSDPAVLVIDERGLHVIPILSGHIGGANALAKSVAALTGAEAVITTATDIHDVFAVDCWAKMMNMTIVHPEKIKVISAKLLAGKTVTVKSIYPLTGDLPEGLVMNGNSPDIRISHLSSSHLKSLILIPKVLTLGIGCRKGVTCDVIEDAWKVLIGRTGCDPHALRAAASIDLKKEEKGILEFCHVHKIPYLTYSADELKAVPGVFSASDFVQSVTGVDNVCERSAIRTAGLQGKLILKKTVFSGLTLALAVEPYTVHFDR